MTFNSTDLILSSRVRVTVVFYDLIHTSDSKRLFPSGEFLLGRSGFKVAGTRSQSSLDPWIEIATCMLIALAADLRCRQIDAFMIF